MNSYKFATSFLFSCWLLTGNCALTEQNYDIIIQSDYWGGSQCLENGVPWQVPASIYKEAENLSKDDIALECGTGGSTIFLAKRCKYVIAIETDAGWAEKVKERLNQLNLKNVNLLHIPNQSDIESFIRNSNTEEVTVFSADTTHGYSRSAFVTAFLEKGISKQFRMLVADNYGDSGSFPEHFDKEIIQLNDWETFTYDDGGWGGKGTRLYIKKQNSQTDSIVD